MEDIAFFDQNRTMGEPKKSRAADINFKRVQKPGLMQYRSKRLAGKC